MKVEYVDHMGTDLTVVNAARVSFNKHKTELDKSDEKLIGYLSKNGHWTPFSHALVTLRMKAPIFIRTQCFKHKQGFTENEVSRRYVDDEPTFFYPDKWRGKATDGAKQGSSSDVIESLYQYTDNFGEEFRTPVSLAYQLLLDRAQELYCEMVIEGIAPEQARMILPQSMYTEWYWTGSLAAYARFYHLRSDPHAQREIQDLAEMVNDVIEPLFPLSWKALAYA